MGENNHGIEPESSEQGTFSEKHLKTLVPYSSPRLRTSKIKIGPVYQPKKIKKYMRYWSAIGDQKKK